MSEDQVTTKRKVIGQILVCSGCCCGRTDKGKPSVPIEWLKKNWKESGLKRSIQLTISGCLGPCDLVNVVSILLPDKQIWIGGLSDISHYEELVKWAHASDESGYAVNLPKLFESHIFDRFRELNFEIVGINN